MDDIITRCPRCGAEMTQSGAEHNKVHYHCQFCGNNMHVEMSSEENSDYWQQRSALLQRVYAAVLDWKTAGWDHLAKDIVSFMGKYEDARYDVCLKTATIACLTRGFHDMDDEKYKECKIIFKLTEKVYKQHIKAIGNTIKEFPNSEDVSKYQEYRVLYKKLRDDYRNTKMLWKVGLTVGRKLFFWWTPM